MGCKFCGKQILNKGSLVAHEKCCHSNPNRVPKSRSPLAGPRKGTTPWNKGLTKDTSLSLRQASLKLKGRPKKSVKTSPETRRKLSESAKSRGIGGYKKGSGRGKSGWYKGLWCDSSWELAFVIHCLDKGVCIRRCSEKRKYWHEGKEKVYHPDFLVEGEVVEVKGRLTEEWNSKALYNPDIRVMGPTEMKPILDEVISTYGRKFTNLYEGFKDRPKVQKAKQPKKKITKPKKVLTLEEKLLLIDSVDFTKEDWGDICSKILGISTRSARRFVLRYSSKSCFRRNIKLSPEQINSRLEAIKDIDMTRYGWVKKVSERLKISHSAARRFINRHYNGEVYKRNSPI